MRYTTYKTHRNGMHEKHGTAHDTRALKAACVGVRTNVLDDRFGVLRFAVHQVQQLHVLLPVRLYQVLGTAAIHQAFEGDRARVERHLPGGVELRVKKKKTLSEELTITKQLLPE
jgi:hypothetical protein